MKNTLQEYAAFVRHHKLNEYVAKELHYLHQFNVPLMEFLKHLSPCELTELTKIGASKLLTGIENGTAHDEAMEGLQKWKDDKLDGGIPRTAVSIKDLILIYSLQKISLIELLPHFTTDSHVSIKLVAELELHYLSIQEMAIEILESIRLEEQEKSNENEQKFKDLFHNSNDLLQIISPEGKIMVTNNAWLKTLRYSEEEVMGKLIYDFVNKDEKEEYIIERKRILNKEKHSTFLRTCYKQKNGKGITLEGYISSKIKNEEVIYTLGIWRDVTERILHEKEIKAINDQLAEREEDLRELIQHAPDAVIVIDLQNVITLWNSRAEEIFGWKQQEVLNKDLSDIIIPASHKEAHRYGMLRFLSSGVSTIINTTVEVPAVHKDGHEIIISITISTTRQAGKQAFIGFMRDITLQKKNELELENKRMQLEKTNHELEQYAWLTSHDLKEPVRKILTFSDALIKKKPEQLSELDSNYIFKINDSARRMNALIDAVLQYSNVSDEASLFAPTDLTTTIKDVLEDLEILIEKNEAIIYVDPMPTLFAIPVQMRQLFQNLITNAIKYRKIDTAPIVHIKCQQDANGFYIQIADNGMGFENIFADKIFKVFQRLIPGKGYEGTGIGLALCKKIVETHHGKIHAESEPSVGSTFFIYLPLNKNANPAV